MDSKMKVENLDLYYGKFKALKNINLDLPKNEITAFIGPSGCGKSTLLILHTLPALKLTLLSLYLFF